MISLNPASPRAELTRCDPVGWSGAPPRSTLSPDSTLIPLRSGRTSTITGRTTATTPKGVPRGQADLSEDVRAGTIGLVINTKNEEAKVAAAIASCLGVDDILVADMASTDDTVTIAQVAGARILELPDVGYCEPGRQAAIEAAATEWVLLLDADERLSPGGLDRLRQVVATAPDHVSSYLIPRPTRLKGQTILGTGWSIDLNARPGCFAGTR